MQNISRGFLGLGLGISCLVLGWSPQVSANGISEQCVETFTNSLAVQAVGKKCGWLDTAVAAKLETTLQAANTCIADGANAAQKELLPKKLLQTTSHVNNQMANMICDAAARNYFDTQIKASTAGK